MNRLRKTRHLARTERGIGEKPRNTTILGVLVGMVPCSEHNGRQSEKEKGYRRFPDENLWEKGARWKMAFTDHWGNRPYKGASSPPSVSRG